MPRPPSARLLQDRCDVWHLRATGAGLDADGTLSGANYPGTRSGPDAAAVPCGWSSTYGEREDADGRVSTVVVADLLFRDDPAVKLGDKLVVTTAAGRVYTVFASGPADDMAGLGPWAVVATAKL